MWKEEHFASLREANLKMKLTQGKSTAERITEMQSIPLDDCKLGVKPCLNSIFPLDSLFGETDIPLTI